jgi:hypothetical protein
MKWNWRRFGALFVAFAALHVFLIHYRAAQRGTEPDFGGLGMKATYAVGGAALWNVLLGLIG